jgi:tetratricopeptide (TPR) repeat protein
MTRLPSSRISVFVSSTIGECAAERTAARRAIESLNYEPILFESIGARPHPARATYLEGLSRSNICIIIWKENYGYIDPHSGLGISGIEDEYRQAKELGRDILLYIKSSVTQRDPRLTALIDEARIELTTHSYEIEADLAEQICADLTSVVSQVFIERSVPRAGRLLDPSAVLSGIIPAGSSAIERPRLEHALDEALRQQPVCWVIGPQGSGKTVLLAQWAIRHGASYVNARGLSLRNLIRSLVTSLSDGASADAAFASIDEGLDVLRSVWTKDARWPLVIDDPADPGELAALLKDFEGTVPQAQVVIATRSGQESSSVSPLSIPGLDRTEVAELTRHLPAATRGRVEAAIPASAEVLPLDLRKAMAATLVQQHLVFDDVSQLGSDAKTRELLALIVASPEPLTLKDLMRLSSSEDESPVTIDGRLSSIAYLIMDDGLGYRPVHEEIATELRGSLAQRPALHRFVSLRLAQFFVRAKRYASAFELYRAFDPAKALSTAYRAASQAMLEGRWPQSVAPLEYITAARRTSGERLDLGISLLSLAQAYDSIGNSAAASECRAEAEQAAAQLGDDVLRQLVEDQRLIARVRRELRPADLTALREIRQRYNAEGRIEDSARLGVEEGAILIGVGDHNDAIPPLREARATFLEVGDRHGIQVATRNLVVCLNMVQGGQGEAEQLLKEIRTSGGGFNQLRDRAWMCNMLARRYRLDGLVDKAVAAAQEAIEIGTELGDPHLVALNRVALGNGLRAKKDLPAALEAFRQAGREAQQLKRKELDGLASRLAAEVLVQMAEDVAPYERPRLLGEADIFASHAIGMLRDSIAEYQAAEALDTRADARIGLGRVAEAKEDYASAARAFAALDHGRAAYILRHLVANTDFDHPRDSMRVLLAALPPAPAAADESNAWLLLIALIEAAVMRAPPRAVGALTHAALRIAQNIIVPQLEVGLWLRLFSLAVGERKIPDDGRGAFVLSAFLAHTRERQLSLTQLSALTDQTLGASDNVHFHTASGRELQITLKLGKDDGVLLVIDDLESIPSTRFVALALASFFTGYRQEIYRDFLAGPIEGGTYIRVSVLDMAQAPADIRQQLEQAASDAPVAIAHFGQTSQSPRHLIVACRPDVQQRCQGDPLKATDLLYMYADVLRAVLQLGFGGDLEDEVLRPKIVSLLRSTID